MICLLLKQVAEMTIMPHAQYVMEGTMRVIRLKEFFELDCKYDWESKEFAQRSLELLQEDPVHKFFERSPSRDKDFKKQLSDLQN